MLLILQNRMISIVRLPPNTNLVIMLKATLTAFILLASCDSQVLDPHANNSGSKSTKQVPLTTLKIPKFATQIHYFIVNQNSYSLELVDQSEGPGTLWENAEKAAIKNNAIGAINAGFFTPEGKPLGICISNSKRTGSLNKTSIGSGCFIVNRNGTPVIVRRAEINSYKNPKSLVQAGPFLIENKKPIKVKDGEPRPRSFIAQDGKGNWLFAMVESISMPNLVSYLQGDEIPGFAVTTALNLDGGRSSQIYHSDKESQTSKQVAAFMHRKVRNYIVIKEKN